MLTREDVIKKLHKEYADLKSNFGVKRIAIFGSFANNTQTRASDIDIVVELAAPLGLNFFDLVDRLETVLNNRVDILTADGLKTMRVKEVADSIARSLLYV